MTLDAAAGMSNGWALSVSESCLVSKCAVKAFAAQELKTKPLPLWRNFLLLPLRCREMLESTSGSFLASQAGSSLETAVLYTLSGLLCSTFVPGKKIRVFRVREKQSVL